MYSFIPDDKDDLDSVNVLNSLESIDDDCDRHGIALVKMDDRAMAERMGIDADLPALVYYERRIPNVYRGNLANEDEVLGWLIHQVSA